jgi:hypothetical protein
VDVRGRSGEIHLTGYPGDRAGCARCSGWFRTIAELSGARNVTLTHRACGVRRDAAEIWSFQWE